MTEGVRVLIADDHPPTRAGIRAALEEADFEICAEAGDAAQAVEQALTQRPDVALLDIHMPGNGITAAAEISINLPQTAVVMLTFSGTEEDLFSSLRAGASGYLLKDIDPSRLPEALRGVLAGEAPLSGNLVARLIDEFRARGKRTRFPGLKDRGEKLTDREWEILELLKGGLSTAEVAERLTVSPATIRSHLSTILKKLRVSSREEALRLLDEH